MRLVDTSSLGVRVCVTVLVLTLYFPHRTGNSSSGGKGRLFGILIVRSCGRDLDTCSGFSGLLRRRLRRGRVCSSVRAFCLSYRHCGTASRRTQVCSFLSALDFGPSVVVSGSSRTACALVTYGRPLNGAVPIIFSNIGFPG